jgi:hypothetical protein
MNNAGFASIELSNELNFKQCHYCQTNYCSKECRKNDWQNHKLTDCYYGNLSSLCKRILSKIGRCYRLRMQLSKISKTAYLSTLKRGFVWLDFSSKNEAQSFCSEPIVLDDSLTQQQQKLNTSSTLSDFLFYFGNNLLPKYVCFENFDKDHLDDDKLSSQSIERNDLILKSLFNIKKINFELNDYNNFKNLCLNYDPKNEFILLISIQTNSNDIQKNLKPNNKYTYNKYVLKYMKFKFVDKETKSILKKKQDTEQKDVNSTLMNEIDTSATSATLILTSLCKTNDVENDEENRQLFMANLMTEFETRGINIRLKFPKLYRDLSAYVENNKPLTPLCLFPRDLNSNNLFVCLIVPNSEPSNYSWMYEDDVEKNLNLANYLFIA